MPKSARYTLSWSPERADYLITGSEQVEPDGFSLAWLAEHRAFAFHGRNGQINLLKEKRRRGGEGYWYAYRRYQGQMSKRYVGRDEQVSIERLEAIAVLLTSEAETMAAEMSPAEPGEQALAAIAPASDLPVAQAHPLFFEPLLLSKLQLPRLQKTLLTRDHLLLLLDQGLERKVTLLDAPAGYGKTTLIGQWVASRESDAGFPRVASVMLDASDNDPIRFWRYVVAACQKFAPEVGKEALALLLAYRLPSFQFKPLEMMLVALLNELSQLEHPGILIIDDLHVIQSSQVMEMLSFFLEHLPSTLHLILLMRGDLPFSLMRLRARNELLDISPSLLSFSLEETRAFFASQLSCALSPRSARELHQRLEGWPTGLRLFSSLLSQNESEQEIEQLLANFVGKHWSLREYFLGEVLHRLPEKQQEFLLQTSVLPRVAAALCDTLMGREDSTSFIEVLRQGDFFLIPLDATGEWSRYQSLFAETMQQEARIRLGDARLNELAIRASIWYEEHEMLPEAIETALNAAAFGRASSLVTRFIKYHYQNNRFIFLEIYNLKRWLEDLPTEELERNPDFCLHYAMILLFTLAERPRVEQERERVYHLLWVAEQQWRDANDTAKLAAIFSFRALLARQEGRTLQALTWARQALAWLPPEDLVWRTIALTVVGIGAILSGTLAQAREALLEARLLNERLDNAMYARAARGMLSWVHLEQGELRYAAEQFRQMQAEARLQEDRDDIARTQLAFALLLYQWNRLAEAEEAAREAQEMGEHIHEEEFLYVSTLRLAQIERARGQSAQAQQRLTAWLAGNQVPDSPQGYQRYREVQAMLASIQLANGELVAVERWCAGLEQRSETLPLYQRQREQLLHARLLLARGEHTAAMELLEGLLAAAQQTGHGAFVLDIQVARVMVYVQQSQREKAREQLSALLAAGHSEGYLRLFLDEGKIMATLLRELLPQLREKALSTYARAILAAFAKEDHEPLAEKAAGQTFLHEPLSPQEQKVLRLLVAGSSNGEIARELVVSVNTIRTQVQSIYRKLDVNNRVQASAMARQLELL